MNYQESIQIENERYPLQLKKLKTPPSELWIQGEMPDPSVSIVGIIGTRHASEWGKKIAKDFAMSLSRAGIWTVSGLARGIDTAAHTGSIGKTIGVLGSGLNEIYPSENFNLSRQITLITQFPPNAPPHAWNFPKRNTLVAAFSDALLVVEAPEKSGSIITVNEALKLGKKCFAIPGPIDKENFRGSNRLIQEGKATLCQGVEEILAFLKKEAPAITPLSEPAKCSNPEELNILSLLAKEDLSFDQLILLTGFTASVLNVHLMGLVLKRAIKEYPGRIYGKIVNHR